MGKRITGIEELFDEFVLEWGELYGEDEVEKTSVELLTDFQRKAFGEADPWIEKDWNYASQFNNLRIHFTDRNGILWEKVDKYFGHGHKDKFIDDLEKLYMFLLEVWDCGDINNE